jgi:DNA invertase Pin-like site-specific DNA recombinase
MIVERVKAGLTRARSQGKRLGRRPVTQDVVERIRERLGTGRGILRVAKELGVGTGTVHRVKRALHKNTDSAQELNILLSIPDPRGT